MSKAGIKRLIGELIGDDEFRNKFLSDPEGTMKNSGFALSDLEIDTLKELKDDDLKFEVKTGTEGLAHVTIKEVSVI